MKKTYPINIIWGDRNGKTDAVGGSGAGLYFLKQVHGADIVVFEDVQSQDTSLIEADGMITRTTNCALAVRTADCLPVALYDPKTSTIGMVHAGWRGTRQKILARAIDTMRHRFGARAEDILIRFGPSIRPCCYEVGAEFQSYFPGFVFYRQEISCSCPKGGTGKFYFDLAGVNQAQAVQAGIAPAHIEDTGICTCCTASYYSYRREGEAAGRNISFIVKTEEAI